MREDVGLLNPDATDVLADRAALDGKSEADLTKEAKEATQGIQNALKEMSGEFKWKLAKSLPGENDSEKITGFKKMLVRRTATTQMLQERREFNRQKQANEEALAAIEAGANIGDTAHSDSNPNGQPQRGFIGPRNDESAENVAKKFVNTLETDLGPISAGGMDQKAPAWTDRLRKGITLDIHPGNLILPEVENVISGAGTNDFHIWPEQTDRVIEAGREPFELIQVMPRIPVMSNTWEYRAETTAPNHSSTYVETNEGAAFGSQDYKWEEKMAHIRKIGSLTEVTFEQLEDGMQLAAILARVMRTDLMRRIDYQILNGDGTAPNISGLMNGAPTDAMNPGSGVTEFGVTEVLTQLLTDIEVDGYTMATHLIMHCRDWAKTVTQRDTEDRLLLGAFGMAGQTNPRPMLWGTPLIKSLNIAEGTVFGGDILGFSSLLSRQGVMVQATDTHSDNFGKLVTTIRIFTRLGVARFRDAAFHAVTSYEPKKTGA